MIRTYTSLLAFQLRYLSATSFFLQTALLTPLSFAALKLVALWGTGALSGTQGAGAVQLDAANSASNLDQLWFDASVAGLWSTTTLAVGIIGFQRFQGVLQYLVASALPKTTVFGSIVAAAAVLGLLGIPLVVLLTGIVGVLGGTSLIALSLPKIGAQLLGLVLATLACVASAAALSALCVLSPQALAYEPLVLIPVWIVSGVVVPSNQLPAVLQFLGALHPLTWAVSVAHADTWDWHIWVYSAVCLVLSAVLLGCASWGLKVAQRKALVDGTLGLS